MKIIQFYFILAVFVTLSIFYFTMPAPEVVINKNYINKCNGTIV